MAFNFSTMTDSCLSVFGQEFSFERVTSLADALPTDPTTITGILEAGSSEEGTAPGDDSTYARLWAAADVIALKLQKGDEISTATTVYVIVDIKEDAGEGLWFLMRKDRDVI